MHRDGLSVLAVADGQEPVMDQFAEARAEMRLAYGAALNEGRALFPSDEQFGQWVSGNLPHTERHERAAAMWAAATCRVSRSGR